MLKVVIVDDEPLARDVLETYVDRLPDLELVAKCSNAIEANQVLRDHAVDLMFLDIQMPELTGIDFLKSLSNPPQVIFTTAYPDYAIEGFELNAVDYLLKPIAFDRFMKAVNKAESKSTIMDEEEDYFFVKADKKLIKVKYDSILYIEGLKDYVIIRHDEGRVITLQTMKSLETKLPKNKFKRIHRSFIANIDKIKAVEGNMIHLEEKGKDKVIPIGKNYRDELLRMINDKKL